MGAGRLFSVKQFLFSEPMLIYQKVISSWDDVICGCITVSNLDWGICQYVFWGVQVLEWDYHESSHPQMGKPTEREPSNKMQ